MTTPTKAKKITELPENTTISDDDLFVTGMGGTSAMGKTKWSKILDKIRSVLFANNLTTNTAGYGMDARQGPVIDKKISDVRDSVSELNTNLKSRNYISYSQTAGSLSDILTGADQPNGFIFYQSQFATDKPESGMSFTITCRANNSWGFQFLFANSGHIYARDNSNGTVSSWRGPL